MSVLLSMCTPLSAPAQLTWSGASSNTWTDPSNWNSTRYPGDGVITGAVINLGSPSLNQTLTILDLTLGGGQINGTLSHPLTIQNTFSWSGGTIGAGASLRATGSLLLSNTLNNVGVLAIDLSGGTVNASGLTALNNSGTITVAGVLMKITGGTNSGWLEVANTGTVLFQSVSGYTIAPGAVLAGTGMFVDDTTLNVQGAVNVGHFILKNTLSGGTLTSTNNLVWTSGFMNGGGQTVINTGATLDLESSSTKTLAARDLINNGTIEWTGEGEWQIQSGATMSNANWMDLSSSASLTQPLGEGLTINSGMVHKSGADKTVAWGVPVSNVGTFHVAQGTLQLSGGGTSLFGSSWIVDSGATLTFAGDVDHRYFIEPGTTLDNDGTTVVTGYVSAPADWVVGNGVTFDGGANGELFVSGNLDANEFTWISGIVSGLGVTELAGGVIDRPWGVGGGRVLENSGTINWSSGASWGAGTGSVHMSQFNDAPATIHNLGSAEFDANIDTTIGLPGAPSLLVFNNDGTFRVAGSKNISFEGAMNNTGTLSVGNGATLQLNGGGLSSGTFVIGNSASLILAGSATHSFASTANVFGPGSLVIAEGTAEFSGKSNAPIAVAGGEFRINSGANILSPNLAMTGGQTILHAGAVASFANASLGTDLGSSTVLKLDHATLHADTFQMNSSGLLWLNEGTLQSPSPIDWTGGSVIGSGTLEASVATHGSLLTPGEELGQIGSLNFSAGLTLDPASIYGVDVDADAKTVDLINISGLADLDDALLLVFVSGNPAHLSPSDHFTILNSASIGGAFTIDSLVDHSVLAYDSIGQVLGQFTVDQSATQVVLSNWVPEPGSRVLLSLGVLAFLRRQRREESLLPERQGMLADCRNGTSWA